MNYDERTMAAYLTDMMDSKVAAEATARVAALAAEETARETAMAALNTAVEHTNVVTGSYQGQYNGASSVFRPITLGFKPRAALVFPAYTQNLTETMVMAVDGVDHDSMKLTDTGIEIRYNLDFINSSPYRYLIWK